MHLHRQAIERMDVPSYHQWTNGANVCDFNVKERKKECLLQPKETVIKFTWTTQFKRTKWKKSSKQEREKKEHFTNEVDIARHSIATFWICYVHSHKNHRQFLFSFSARMHARIGLDWFECDATSLAKNRIESEIDWFQVCEWMRALLQWGALSRTHSTCVLKRNARWKTKQQQESECVRLYNVHAMAKGRKEVK